jgi:hypothetical protein
MRLLKSKTVELKVETPAQPTLRFSPLMPSQVGSYDVPLLLALHINKRLTGKSLKCQIVLRLLLKVSDELKNLMSLFQNLYSLPLTV